MVCKQSLGVILLVAILIPRSSFSTSDIFNRLVDVEYLKKGI